MNNHQSKIVVPDTYTNRVIGMKFKRVLFILLCIMCSSCDVVCDKIGSVLARDNIQRLEKEKKELRTKYNELCKQYNDLNARFTEYKLAHPARSVLIKDPEPVWQYIGCVSLYEVKDVEINKEIEHTIRSSGEGGLYKNTSTGLYQLRFTSGDKKYSYHVSRQQFVVDTDDGMMTFNALAGPCYFNM